MLKVLSIASTKKKTFYDSMIVSHDLKIYKIILEMILVIKISKNVRVSVLMARGYEERKNFRK